MSITDIITIIAILVGPIAAVQVQKFIESTKEKSQRRMYIFRTLMMTRAPIPPPSEQVAALNMIDMEFYLSKSWYRRKAKVSRDQKVLEAWEEYRAHLYNKELLKNQFEIWCTKKEELFVNLLSALADVVGLHFSNTKIKNGAYFPQGHGDQLANQNFIQDNLKKILSGEQAISIKMINNSDLKSVLPETKSVAQEIS